MSTGGELEEVQGENRAGLNTGEVSECANQLLAINLWVIDDQRSTALSVTAATELTLTSTELAGVLGLLDVTTGTDSLQQSNGSGGLLDGSIGKGSRGDDEGHLGHGADLVTAGEEEGGASRGGNGRSSSETLLVLVDLLVPLAPDLGRSEHATGAAHVTEGSLTSAVSSATGDTGNTGHSATSTPGLSRGLVTSLLGAGMC